MEIKKMGSPLVSIICTCFNHEKYIVGALDSVLSQSYGFIELVIIDNGSKDHSVNLIQSWQKSNKGAIETRLILHAATINYCQSFNQGLAIVKGKYLIDLSGDDELQPHHVARAVEALEGAEDAVYFSNAFLVGDNSASAHTFYPINEDGCLLQPVASGNVYEHVVQKNFLCAATLVFKTDALKNEGGYDEDLSYEDFDIIVRLARKYFFVFNEYIGIKKRILKDSFSSKQYSIRNSVMLPSTLKVCQKIKLMNRSQKEDNALKFRVMFETKHALASANFDVALELLKLAQELGISSLRYHLFRFWEKVRWDLSAVYEAIKG
jgi:glycosyltransferase involved in cell wall biosynthesis